jgi:hypothetical protein
MEQEQHATQEGWSTPTLVSYGSIEDITRGGPTCKVDGSSDDLAQGISTVDDSLCDD